MADLTDGIADAIIGAILIGRFMATGQGASLRTDVTPKSDAVFQLDPEVKPRPVKTREDMQRSREQYYRGSADTQERQSRQVIDRADHIPGED
jgi:hypothetical protein